MTVLYLVSLAISLVLLVLLFYLFDYKVSFIYAFIFLILSVCILGYVFLINATDLSEALIANAFSYIGGCFIPFLMLLGICKICYIKQPKTLVIAEFCFCIFDYIIVATSGRNAMNYASVYLDTTGKYARLVKEYGSFHFIYVVSMLGFAMMTFGVIVWSYYHKREVSYKTAITLAIIYSIDVLTYFIERIIHVEYEFLPFAYVITEIGLLILINRIKLYDVSTMVSDYYANAKEYGFVMFDKNLKFMGNNGVAETWVPELRQLKIDTRKTIEESEFLCNVTNIVENGDDPVFYSKYQDIIIKNSVKPLYNKKKSAHIGYYVEMIDDTERLNYIYFIEEYNEKLKDEVEMKTSSLIQMQEDIILSMADTVEDRDASTGGHIRRTSEGVRILVNAMENSELYKDCNEDFFKAVIKAAPLHDFGKIAIDDDILRKPGKYTDEEYEIMKTHSEKGANIVSNILKNSDDELFRRVAENVAHYHHEKWNGKGYPSGLSGNKIPLEARIMALADVFDALVSKRCYKEKYSYDVAFTIMKESLGEHFDPVLGTIFIEQRPRLEEYYDSVR